uniref:Uncharacterized protein n=1 Tax=Rhizophora mucronata TaxID=61149 RepID=A0A2P2PYA0_RHIMU
MSTSYQLNPLLY